MATLGRACGKTDWQVHAWCLMSNHFHVVVETPRANLVPGMKWLLGTYTMLFNHRHRLFGHLFSDRQEIRESPEEKALRRVKDELTKLGWTESELLGRPKGDPKKLRIARVLRQETTMTLGWIAQALHMGTKTHLSHLLYWQGKEKKTRRC
jgi:hypothetical protein